MKILITGGSGFIGKNLISELTSNGHSVDSLDINSQVYKEQLNVSNIKLFKNYVRSSSPDVIYHLAAQVGRIRSEDDIAHTISANAIMTANVAQVAAELNIRLAYVSTSEVYGDHNLNDVNEKTQLKLPHNLYGLSKRWGEEVSQLYAPNNLVIIRPSMPYGPGAPPGRGRRAMDNMLWQANHNMPIIVHRGSERSWCWINDLVNGMRLAIEQPHANVYNIGRDDDPRSMLEIAQMACDIAGTDYNNIQIVDPPNNVTPVKRLSTEKIRNELGWKPTVNLEEGMLKLFDWIKHFDKDGNYID